MFPIVLLCCASSSTRSTQAHVPPRFLWWVLIQFSTRLQNHLAGPFSCFSIPLRNKQQHSKKISAFPQAGPRAWAWGAVQGAAGRDGKTELSCVWHHRVDFWGFERGVYRWFSSKNLNKWEIEWVLLKTWLPALQTGATWCQGPLRKCGPCLGWLRGTWSQDPDS